MRVSLPPSTWPTWLAPHVADVCAVADRLQTGEVVLAHERPERPKVVAVPFEKLPELVKQEITREGFDLGPWPARVLVTANAGTPVLIGCFQLAANAERAKC